MKNPYAGKKLQFSLASGEDIEDLRFPSGKLGQVRDKALANGEINASSIPDLLKNISHLLNASSSGQINRALASDGNDYQSKRNDPQQRRLRREVLAAAAADPTGVKWNQVGVSLAGEINQTASREGFLREFSVAESLTRGEIPRTRLRSFTSVAVVATSASEVAAQLLRDQYFYPKEFFITASISVEDSEINQVSADILDEKYTEGLQAIMVAEDRLWKRSADLTVGVANPAQLIPGSLTPTILTQIRDAVTDWSIPARNLLIANDIWSDIVGNQAFNDLLDPVNRYDLVLTGYLGTLLGMKVRTDGYRQQELKVLDRGEIYVIADPINHANYTTRGDIEVTAIDGHQFSKNTKGWFLSEPFSFILANVRSVSKGVKL